MTISTMWLCLFPNISSLDLNKTFMRPYKMFEIFILLLYYIVFAILMRNFGEEEGHESLGACEDSVNNALYFMCASMGIILLCFLAYMDLISKTSPMLYLILLFSKKMGYFGLALKLLFAIIVGILFKYLWGF